MSDHDRGPYTPPTDAPLSFDARQPVRGARPAPFALIVSVLVLAGLVAAIFLFYRAGVRQAGQAPQTVGQPVGEMKGPASPENQPADPAAGLQIYRSEGGQPPEVVPAQPQFVNPPEQPQPRQTPPPVVMLPPAPAAAPTAPVAAQPLRPAMPAPAPAQAAAPKPLPVKPVPAPAAKPAPVAAASGSAIAQIGAVSSPALADKAWSDAVALAPGLAAGKGKSVERIDKNGGVLYRTAVTGFASRDAAKAFCAKVTAAGKGCFVR